MVGGGQSVAVCREAMGRALQATCALMGRAGSQFPAARAAAPSDVPRGLPTFA